MAMRVTRQHSRMDNGTIVTCGANRPMDPADASSSHRYRAVVSGVERLPRADLPRHRHRAGYATVVLAGAFTEAAFSGRHLATPGDVLLHGRFDCHANAVASARGPTVLRLPWRVDTLEGCHRIADPDRLVRLAERDALEASACLHAMLSLPTPLRCAADRPWPEQLADRLAETGGLSLAQWAEEHGLAPETVSRGFRRAFGVSPTRFRLELRTRRAWLAIVNGDERLSDIAHDHGFADLAHMSRNVSAFTGQAPGAWRARSPVR